MRHLTLSLLMLIGGVALADTWTDSATGYTWTYADVDGGVEIRGERTGGWWSTSYAAAIDPAPTGRLDVPVTLGGKPVVSIGKCAFYDCNEIEGITIPDTVVNIGDFAFTCIHAYNTALHDVEIPNSVTNIGESIFKGCKNLTNVVIGTGVKCIGESAFNGCPISEMSIPDSVVEVQQGAFYNCTNLNRICVGTGLKTLGYRNPFAVSSIRTFEVADGNANFMSSNGLLLSKDGRNLISGVNGNVSIPNGVTNVYPHAFYFFNTEESVNITIPRSVVSIGECAFDSNWKLARILIPDGVETIGECAFSGCGLTNVIVAASVTNIGACAFGDGFSDRFTSRRIYFEGNAPVCQKVSDREIFHLVSKQYPPVVYVQRGSKGWDGDPDSSVLPNKWQGCEIKWYGVGVSINARQRYPWNGLVDLHFTITGDAGTKYDTSFTAKDMVGNTNIAMRTIRKADGTAAAAKEQLLPGTYTWIWDAAADLPKDFKCDRVTVTGSTEEGHGKVQLWAGGPYWATTNIGATKPEEYGYYFWWGDTIGYKRANNKWVASDGSSSDFSFYDKSTCNQYHTTLRNNGWTTSGDVLTSEHDAARVHWGGGWRMPTFKEFKNLIDKCDWTWSTVNGIKGYIVRGRSGYASANIFLPAAGFTYEKTYVGAGANGYYWSSVPNCDGYSTLGYGTSCRLTFSLSSHSYSTSGHTDYNGDNCSQRYYGLSVRPVQNAK